MKLHTALAALALMTGSATAQDLILYGGAELEFTHDEDGPDTGTDSYLRGYLEAEINGFYAGLEGKVSDERIENRADVYLGYRNETAGGLSYDFGLYRYNYVNDSASNYTEAYVSLGVPVGEQFSTTLDLYYDIDNELGSAYLGAAFAATDVLEVSANYGVYEVDGAGSETEWDLGATYSLGEETAVDLRYYDGSEYEDSYLGLSLTWDTTILGG
ncbi:hypothetical protein [Tabrizicola sp.]|uniref:hypothetical protein n=1 Tax=Tabrizicola sp. TaxID=2005166 RepID=UPI003F3CB0B7